MPLTKLGLAQFEGVEDIAENVTKVETLVGRAADQGADLVAFHEFATTLYWCYEDDARFFDWAEPIPGPSTDRIAKAATNHGIDVVFPLYERDGDEFWNTMTLIQPGRGVTGKYRKSHVPTTTSGGVPSARESQYFNAGDTGFVPLETSKGLKIGFLPCYDRHFPEAYRSYALRGTELILCPSASYKGFANTFWVEELQVMAFQHQLFVAGVNRIGPVWQREGDEYPGRAVVVDPRGTVLALGNSEEGLTFAEIDSADVERVRNDGLLVYKYRRPDLYEIGSEISQSA